AASHQRHKPSWVRPEWKVCDRIGVGLREVALSNVWCDPDDGCRQRRGNATRWWGAARQVHTQHDSPAERILLGEVYLREPLVDDGGHVARLAIQVGEDTSTDEL